MSGCMGVGGQKGVAYLVVFTKFTVDGVATRQVLYFLLLPI